MNIAYSEKLKHPKWQRRRLEILQRDNFTCQLCADTETTLNIHHKEYHKGEIWEYKDDELVTYCEVCHMVIEYIKKEYKSATLLALYKQPSETDENLLNIVGLIKYNNEQYTVILYLNKQDNVLTFILSMGSITLNKINELVNNYSK